jgi:hypothetical protein
MLIEPAFGPNSIVDHVPFLDGIPPAVVAGEDLLIDIVD